MRRTTVSMASIFMFTFHREECAEDTTGAAFIPFAARSAGGEVPAACSCAQASPSGAAARGRAGSAAWALAASRLLQSTRRMLVISDARAGVLHVEQVSEAKSRNSPTSVMSICPALNPHDSMHDVEMNAAT